MKNILIFRIRKISLALYAEGKIKKKGNIFHRDTAVIHCDYLLLVDNRIEKSLNAPL